MYKNITGPTGTKAYLGGFPDTVIQDAMSQHFERVLPMEKESTGEGWLARTANLGIIRPFEVDDRGRPTGNDLTNQIKELRSLILGRVSASFGNRIFSHTLYWRETPEMNIWYDKEANRRHLTAWVSFTVDGWAIDRKLTEVLGVSELPFEVI